MGPPRIPAALVIAAAVAGGALGPAPRVRAESSVVRDTRLHNLGAAPALGRGYTPAISALHSICFDKMPVTTASYDFDYSFEELDATVSARTSVRHLSLRTHEVDEFVREQTRETTITEGFVKQHVHYLLAVLVVESYYASIDEAQSELSKHALELLTDGDVHGFFTGCGTHYIRSMSRRSFFLTMFSYTSTDKTRDRSFERQLEQQVRRFHGSTGPTAEDQEHEKKFTERARTRSLKVVTRSIGLPSRANADMLPFDLGSYKKAVKEAFKASQEPGAGRVVAMEIMPWLSNTRVLVTLDLGAAGVAKSEWIERKRILADNSEFYIELASALQELNTQVHRAEACRRELDQDVMDGDKIAARFASAQVISHRSGRRAPLKDLVETLLVASAGLTACDPGDDGDGSPDAAPVDPSCPLWYLDDDGDHFGDENDPGERHCENPGVGRVENNTDCDDTKDWVNPTEQEVCDGVDNDCNGQIETECPAGCVPVTMDPEANGDDRDYLICNVALQWDAARSVCLQQGYDFVHIGSAAENTALRQFATSRAVNTFIIGGTDAEDEGNWIWVDANRQFWTGTWQGAYAGPSGGLGNPTPGQTGTGLPVTGQYQNWIANQEPNDFLNVGVPAGEDCMTMIADGRWNDVPCALPYTYAFACERITP